MGYWNFEQSLLLWGPGVLILIGMFVLSRDFLKLGDKYLDRLVQAQERQSVAITDLTGAIREQSGRDTTFQDQQRILLDLCLQEIRALAQALAQAIAQASLMSRAPAAGCAKLDFSPRECSTLGDNHEG